MADAARRLLDGVVLQRKLTRDVRGIAHLCLTYSFLTLAVGSLVVQVDGVILAPRFVGLGRGAAWEWLQGALDVAGVVMILAAGVGLAGLRGSARGGHWRPVLGRAVALSALLLLSATGLLTEGVRLALAQHDFDRLSFVGRGIAALLDASTVDLASLYGALWSLHLVLALVLIATLPWTFLRHVLLAPIAIARSSGQTHAVTELPFDLRTLIAAGDFDVSTGLGVAEDLTPAERAGALACVSCHRCTDACPVAAGSPLAPSAVITGLARALTTAASRPLEVITPAALWSCAQCGACDDACPVHVHPRDLILGLRRHAAGSARSEPTVGYTLRALDAFSNPYAQPPRGRLTLARRLAALGAEHPADGLVYWLGCAASFDDRIGRVALATGELLWRAGVGFQVLGAAEGCCGEPARRLGDEGRFQASALANIEQLKSVGATRLVTHCAHCHLVLGRDYPLLGGHVPVVDHATLLADLVTAGRLIPSDCDERWTVHDACNLRRQQGLVDGPRRVLGGAGRKGLRVVEMPGAATACCGGGGGRVFSGVSEAEPPALRRLRQAKAVGAVGLATECPFCLKMFDEAGGREPGVRVADIAEILLERCPAPPPRPPA